MPVQQIQTKNWCFTLNNYTEDSYNSVKEMLDCECDYFIIGKEVGESGTQHLQGYLQLKTKKRFNQLKVMFGEHQPHLEKAKGSPDDNKKYCSKDGDFEEHGSIAKPGKKKLTDAIKDMLDGKSRTELMEVHGDNYVRNKRKLEEVAHGIAAEKRQKRVNEAFQKAELRPWQVRVMNDLMDQKESQVDRTINWIFGESGNEGKTFFSHYMRAVHDALVVTNAKNENIAYAYNYEDHVIFDLTRSQIGMMNYSIIEHLKNGHLFSTKYECQVKLFESFIINIIYCRYSLNNRHTRHIRFCDC